MENASKALMIAGGILLAILTLSLVVYMMTAVTTMAEAQDAKALAEQITAFNKEYESYNKRIMYGTDVITVINKAINHNQSIAAQVDDPYYINIKLFPIEKFETVVEKIDNTKEYYDSETLKGIQITDDIKTLLKNPSNSYNSYLEANKEENLGTWQNGGEGFVTNNNFKAFFAGDAVDKTATTPDKKTTYKMYSALTNFKRAIFTCPEDGVKYNEETGRIEEMKFIQTKTATY